MALSAAGADLVAIHSGGGGYSGWMQSAGMSIIADGEPSTRARLRRALDSDTGIGVLRYATAGYTDAAKAAHNGGETGKSPLSWLE
jgi:urocanate hydratase